MRPYPTSLQQHNRPPGEHPLQLRFQLNAPPSRERHRGMEAEVPLNIQQHSATFSNIQQHSATFSNIQQHSATFSNTHQHSATFSNIQQHRDAQDGAARIGEGHPRVRSAVSVVENDQREGQEPQYQGVHGQAEVHPITLPSRFIGNRGVNLPDEVKRFLCHHSQEPLQNLPTYTPPHLTLLHTLHVSYNKAYHITHFPHYR